MHIFTLWALLFSTCTPLNFNFISNTSQPCYELTQFNKYITHCKIWELYGIINKIDTCLKPETLPDIVYYHQYIVNTKRAVGEWNEQGILASVKSYLTTQNLTNSKLIIWVDKTSINAVKRMGTWRLFPQNIEIRYLDYDKEIKGTPLERSPFFSAYETALNSMRIDNFSSVVRYLLLHNYGGFYFDNDGMFKNELYLI